LPELKRKEGLSSFDISVVSRELDRGLKGYYIDNIYQVGILMLLLKLNMPGKPPQQLLIEAGRRINTTRYVVEKPRRPSAFSSALRKYLLNGRIQGVEQPGFERIVKIRTQTSKEEFTLIVELFGKGNMILTDSQDIIQHALSYRRMRDRDITHHQKFVYPKPSGLNPEQVTLRELLEKLRESKGEVVQALTKILSVGGIYSEEFLLSAGVGKNTPAQEVTEEAVAEVYRAVVETLRKKDIPQPCVVFGNEDEPFDVTPFPLKLHSGKRTKSYGTLNEALDEYFIKIGHEEKVSRKEGEGSLLTEEQERIIKEQSAKLDELQLMERKSRTAGNIIFEHAHELNSLAQWIMEKKQSSKDWQEIGMGAALKRERGETPFIYFRLINPQEKSLRVEVDNIEFDLNLRKTVYENASNYFDNSKKMREKITTLKNLIRETSKKLKQTKESREAAETKIEAPLKTKEKRWYEKYRFFHSSEGFLVVSGKDVHSNEALIKRYTEPQDLVFHADVAGAPFTVVKTKRSTPSSSTLQEAAQFTACYSRAWRDGFTSVDVYYVKPDQISKSAPSGEYLARGSFTIKGQRNYIRNVPLRIAIGLRTDGDTQVIAGPAATIRTTTKSYVEVMPGDEPAKKITGRVRLLLSKSVPKELAEKTDRTPSDKFVALIPYGKARIAPIRKPAETR